MNEQKIIHGIRLIGLIIVISITLSFIWREVVFTGVYEVEQVAGSATRLVLAPWPKDRLGDPKRDLSGKTVLPILGESIFFPVSLPRSFTTLTVTADLSAPPPEHTQFGVQIRPGVFWYIKNSAEIIEQSSERTRIRATFDLRGVDQRQHLINILLFAPNASVIRPLYLQRIIIKFNRPSVIDSLRGNVRL